MYILSQLRLTQEGQVDLVGLESRMIVLNFIIIVEPSNVHVKQANI